MDSEKILDIIDKLNPAIRFQGNQKEIIIKILVRCLLEISLGDSTLDFIYDNNYLTQDQKDVIKDNEQELNKLRDAKVRELLETFSQYF